MTLHSCGDGVYPRIKTGDKKKKEMVYTSKVAD